MKRIFNYDAVDLWDKDEKAEDVPEGVLKQLNIYSSNPVILKQCLIAWSGLRKISEL